MDRRRMCPNCRAFISSDDRSCPYCGVALQKASARTTNSGTSEGFIPEHAFTTFIILLINAAIWAISVIISRQNGNQDALMQLDNGTLGALGAKWTPYIRQYGQWWRLVTAGFLHGGLIHILMNGWAMLQLGRNVDVIYGSARYLVIFFTGTVAGFYLSTIISPGSLSVGASAGLCGLVGSLIAVGFLSSSSVALEVRRDSLRSAAFLLIAGFICSITGMWPIDNMAHLGGIGGGFAAAMVVGLPQPVVRTKERLWTLAAWICVLLTVYSFYQMLEFYTQTHHVPVAPRSTPVIRQMPERQVL